MDNLTEKLNSLLSDPGTMAQLQAMAGSLGLTPEEKPEPPPQEGELMGKLGALAPLLSMSSREDDSTRLLQALRPLLSHERQERLDRALKMLRIMRMIPTIKDSGLLNSLI